MEQEKAGALVVKMFGSFSLLYNGKSLSGQKTAESQFIYLMQMVLHHRKKGISRAAVEEVLFGDRDIEDPRHAFRSVLYNAKKKLERGGCPRADYFIQRNGMIFWNEAIPVEEDAEKFEQLYAKARGAQDNEERLQFLLQACHTYTGEFPEMYAGILWAAAEGRRYRAMFYRCVEEIVELLRDKQDYMTMQEVGLYADTVERYFEERGLKPSQRLMDSLRQLGEAILHFIRRSDVVNRYGKGQYLILLLNISLENCKVVQKRIDGMFRSGRQRTGVKYHVSSTL